MSEKIRKLIAKWPHDMFLDGPTFREQEVHSSECRRCQIETALAPSAGERVVAHDAAIRLEEANWWALEMGKHPTDLASECRFCQRVLKLEQAALTIPSAAPPVTHSDGQQYGDRSSQSKGGQR